MPLSKNAVDAIGCLLCNAGWLDYPDEIVARNLEDCSYEETLEYCKAIDELVQFYNSFQEDEDDKLSLNAVEELEQVRQELI